MSHDPKDCMFSSIDNFINSLNAMKDSWDTWFTDLQDRHLSQEEFDLYVTTKVNPAINAKLNELRTVLLNALKSMYKQYEAIEALVSPIADANPTDLQSVIQAVKNIIEWFKKAYQYIQDFLTLLPEHLTRLTSAITDIVSYTPPIHGYSLEAIDIQMDPITMEDITGG